MEFHGEFLDIKYVDVTKRENVRDSWDVKRVSSHESPLAQLPCTETGLI
jgi:hypothetical protein